MPTRTICQRTDPTPRKRKTALSLRARNDLQADLELLKFNAKAACPEHAAVLEQIVRTLWEIPHWERDLSLDVKRTLETADLFSYDWALLQCAASDLRRKGGAYKGKRYADLHRAFRNWVRVAARGQMRWEVASE